MRRITALLMFAAIAGCGQTGDLYLPDARPDRAPTQAPETPTEEEKDDEETPAG